MRGCYNPPPYGRATLSSIVDVHCSLTFSQLADNVRERQISALTFCWRFFTAPFVICIIRAFFVNSYHVLFLAQCLVYPFCYQLEIFFFPSACRLCCSTYAYARWISWRTRVEWDSVFIYNDPYLL